MLFENDMIAAIVVALSEHELEVKKCSLTHFQILSAAGKPIVNVWPTTSRYLAVQPSSGERACVGTVEAIVAYAIKINALAEHAEDEEKRRIVLHDAERFSRRHGAQVVHIGRRQSS